VSPQFVGQGRVESLGGDEASDLDLQRRCVRPPSGLGGRVSQAFFEDGTDDDVQGDYSGILWIIVQFVVMFMNLLFIVLFFMVCMQIASFHCSAFSICIVQFVVMFT
jgi:hypothetical protein